MPEKPPCFSTELLGVKLGDDLQKTLSAFKSKYSEANKSLSFGGANEGKVVGEETMFPVAYSADPVTVVTLGTPIEGSLAGKISSVQVSGQINGNQKKKPFLFRDLKLGSTLQQIKKSIGEPAAKRTDGEYTYWSFKGLNPDCNVEILKGRLSSIRIK